MKFNRYIFGAVTMLCMMFLSQATAQDVRLKCMQWNVKSLEYTDNSNAVYFSIDEFVTTIQEENPDLILFNEFETGVGRMSSVEKLTEFGQRLDMFPYVIFSYVKDKGIYGNGILSKYPIINTSSHLLGKYTGPDQRSVGWVDILVPTDAKPKGVKVRVVCTHLEAFNGTTIPGNEIRKNQAEEIIKYALKPALDENTPIVLMGDLNEGADGGAVALLQTVGVRLCNDAGTFGGSKLDYLYGFPKGKWSCPDYKVKTGGRLDILSDHYPIVGTAVLAN